MTTIKILNNSNIRNYLSVNSVSEVEKIYRNIEESNEKNNSETQKKQCDQFVLDFFEKAFIIKRLRSHAAANSHFDLSSASFKDKKLRVIEEVPTTAKKVPKFRIKDNKVSVVAPIPTIPSLSSDYLDYRDRSALKCSPRRPAYLRQRPKQVNRSPQVPLPGSVQIIFTDLFKIWVFIEVICMKK